MAHFVRRSTLVAGVVGCLLCGSLSGAAARIARVELSNVLSAADAALCDFSEGASNARATLFLQWTHRQTWLMTIIVDNARPHALFTVWVFLDGNSPLTGVAATPMVRSGLVNKDLVDVTPPRGFPFGLNGVDKNGVSTFAAGVGDTTQYDDSSGPTGPGFGTRSVIPNGFYTNRFGWGIFTTHLDFDPVDGPYPFKKVTIPERMAPGAVLEDVSILADFPLGVVSHCKDEKAHGLVNLANKATGDQAWFYYAR